MSDHIKHECGIAFLRLLKPLDYYKKKVMGHLWYWAIYGTSLPREGRKNLDRK